MEVMISYEYGYWPAVKGIGFSYGIEDMNRLEAVAYRLCDKDGGHNKFLESIQVWIEITAARYWWQEFDTYRVGTTKQSESTIHTICKNKLSQDNFENYVSDRQIDYMNDLIDVYNNSEGAHKKEIFKLIKSNLPEGYLQKRMVCTNYKVLSNIIAQRKNHVLDEWHYFIAQVLEQIEHRELLLKRYGEDRPWKLKE